MARSLARLRIPRAIERTRRKRSPNIERSRTACSPRCAVKVLDDPAAADTQLLGRYTPGSIPARLALETPYNRSFELVPAEIRGAALLVHGLSDSPYSMRALADTLYAQGYYVLALRLPGHGTVPAALTEVSWRDWYAAVALAARYAASQAPGKPFIAAGHSTGAALVTLILRARARRSDSAEAARPLSHLSRDRDLAVRGAHERARRSRVHPGAREVALARRAARSTTRTSTTLSRSTPRTRSTGSPARCVRSSTTLRRAAGSQRCRAS